MKTLEFYMNLPYRLEIIPDLEEGGFTARYPELPGCITCGETEISTLNNAIDAKRVWIEAALEDGFEIPEPGIESSARFSLRLPKSLYRSLQENAKWEGVSMNQYCVYLLSVNDRAKAAHAN